MGHVDQWGNRSGTRAGWAWVGLLTVWSATAVTPAPEAAPSPAGSVLPLWFERNLGQADPRYGFVAPGRGVVHFVGSEEVAVWLASGDPPDPDRLVRRAPRQSGARSLNDSGSWVRFRWLGARPLVAGRAEAPLPGRVHYLLGHDPSRWIRNVPLSRAIRFPEIYPGIDVVYSATEGLLEVDFRVAPGAQPDQIRMAVEGADEVTIDAHGDLVVRAGDKEFRQHRPRAFQESGSGRVEIDCAFAWVEEGQIGFRLGRYDRTRPLIIDPVFRHASYLGGGGEDIIWAVASDGAGAGYLAGESTSAAWLVRAGGFQTNYAGGTTVGGDAFVAKVSADGSRLVYLTYLGGWAHDAALAMAVDADGSVYVTGFTASSNFPTARPWQASLAGQPDRTLGAPPLDAFVAKLGPEGDELLFSTFFGGSGIDEGIGVALDPVGRVVITGLTESTNLPLAQPLQARPGGGQDAFVACFSADGQQLLFGTYLGGSGPDYGTGVAVDRLGRIWVTGVTRSTNFWSTNAIQSRINDPTGLATNLNTLSDAFVCRLSSGFQWEMATYLGGTLADAAARIVTDGEGNAYVVGTTESWDFPVTTTNLVGSVWTNRGLGDVFVTKISGQGSTGWVYSVAFGGTGRDEGWDLAVDAQGQVHLIGSTFSTNFPAVQVPEGGRSTPAGGRDVVLVGLDPHGQRLTYAFLYGGSGHDSGYALALDPAGHGWIGGRTTSTNLWTRQALQPAFAGGPGDAFFARLLHPPRLEIRLLSGQRVEVSWPAPSSEWELLRQSPPGVGSWEWVAPAPAATSGVHRLEFPVAPGAEWFRLRLP